MKLDFFQTKGTVANREVSSIKKGSTVLMLSREVGR